MKMQISALMIFLLSASPIAFAKGASKATVINLDPDLDLSGLDPQRYEVQSFDDVPRELPPPLVRDRILHEAGITADELEGFDELAKDMLLLKAKHKDATALRAEYPKIAPAKLSALQKAMKR